MTSSARGQAGRVVVVTTSYPRHEGDPSGHFVAAEVEMLVRRGHEVTVLCPGLVDDAAGVSPHVVQFADHGLFGWPGALPRLRERPLRALGAARFVVGARTWLRRVAPPEQLIAHWLVPSGWPIALSTGAAVEVVAHGSDVRLLERAPALARLVVRQLLARGARFRFVSGRLLDQLAELVGPELHARSRVELPPLDLPSVPTREQARRQLTVPMDTRLAVVVARLVPGKRVGTVLRAASLIPGAQVVVVGDGPLHEPLRRAFPRVRFAGHLPRPRALAWLAAADVLVSASRAEGAPTAVREARALGVPVVAAPAGDLDRWAADDPELRLIAAAPAQSGNLD